MRRGETAVRRRAPPAASTPRSRQHEAMEPGWRPGVRDMEVGVESAGAVESLACWKAGTCQLGAQGRSLSGLRTTQMCLIRSPATSNANTVTVRPSCWATRPGWPLTVRSRNVMVPTARFAISTQARAICSPPSMGCRKLVARPPPSAVAVAPGSSRPIRASMSLASQACLKARMMPACRAAGRRGSLRRADAAAGRGGQLAARRRGPADDVGYFGEGVAEHVVQDERDALGRSHRFEHDQEGHADRLIQGDPVGRVGRVAWLPAELPSPFGQRLGDPFAHIGLAPGPGPADRLRQMRLATVVSQAPGISMASCCCRDRAYQRA